MWNHLQDVLLVVSRLVRDMHEPADAEVMFKFSDLFRWHESS